MKIGSLKAAFLLGLQDLDLYALRLVRYGGEAVNETGTYGLLRKASFLSLQPVVIGSFNAAATRYRLLKSVLCFFTACRAGAQERLINRSFPIGCPFALRRSDYPNDFYLLTDFDVANSLIDLNNPFVKPSAFSSITSHSCFSLFKCS